MAITAATAPTEVIPEPEQPLARVVVLIPAHNESETIQATIRSILAQTYRPHRVIVMSDNSGDDTVALSRAAGAEVHETVDNTAKKAGAINQAMGLILPTLEDHDFVVTMDADGELEEHCIEVAMQIFTERPYIGGLSGSVMCRDQSNWIETAQAIEYARGRRVMSRHKGKIHVLSGAAAFLRVETLRQVADLRGTKLPGKRGQIMLDDSLTEDYELTLAIQEIGWKVTSTKRCMVITDLMPTLVELEAQRNRWYRGTVETLRMYGWRPYTRFTISSIFFNMLASTVMPLSIIALSFSYLALDGYPDLRLLAILVPLFVTENYLCAKRVKAAMVHKTNRPYRLALTFFPLFLYDTIQFAIYWRAVWHALLRRPARWDGDQVVYV